MQAGARDNDNGSLPAGFVSLAEKSGFFFSSSLGLDDSMLCYQTRRRVSCCGGYVRSRKNVPKPVPCGFLAGWVIWKRRNARTFTDSSASP